MNNKHFYSQIIEIETTYSELEELNINSDEKDHLVRLIDSSMHHTILDLILSELSNENKKTFLKHLSEDDHEKIWNLLNKNINDIEKKIKETSAQIKTEIKNDIQSSTEPF